jgi:hypothetical protein
MHLGFWEGIAHDLSGKGQFRLILQPVMAVILGVRLGIADAKAGKAPFFFRLLTERHGRWKIFKESLSSAVIPLVLAVVIDSILQRITLGYIRPLGALVVGGILVWIPFVAVRGLANRAWTSGHEHGQQRRRGET